MLKRDMEILFHFLSHSFILTLYFSHRLSFYTSTSHLLIESVGFKKNSLLLSSGFCVIPASVFHVFSLNL